MTRASIEGGGWRAAVRTFKFEFELARRRCGPTLRKCAMILFTCINLYVIVGDGPPRQLPRGAGERGRRGKARERHGAGKRCEGVKYAKLLSGYSIFL